MAESARRARGGGGAARRAARVGDLAYIADLVEQLSLCVGPPKKLWHSKSPEASNVSSVKELSGMSE